MIPLAEARRTVIAACSVLEGTAVPLADAIGRALDEDVVANEAVPPFENSAMDGFAVRSGDTDRAPVTLAVIGSVVAGDVSERAVGWGEAHRVMTGAPLPKGADAVCMLERTRPADGVHSDDPMVVVTEPVAKGENVRRAGEDVKAGDIVFSKSTVIGPAHIGVLISCGVSIVRAIPPPRVGVLATGDELIGPSQPLRPGAIRDSNRPALLARLAEDGFFPVDLGTARDDLEGIAEAIRVGATRCDAVMTIGGVSVGDCDFLVGALEKLGAEPALSMQIAIRPAKPFGFGVVGEGRIPVFGLPGNPVSSLVSYDLLVRPALQKMAGRPELDRPALAAVVPDGIRRVEDGKTHFMRVRLTTDPHGHLEARPLAGQGSHQLRSLAEANGLAVVPDGTGIAPGGEVTVLLLDVGRLRSQQDSSWIP